jgi:hypothetical protein
MEKFTNAIKCRHCRCVLETPVFLPCCHSVCKKHEKERKHVVCYECDTEYELPTGGFAGNKSLSEIIDSRIYEKLCKIDFGPEHKSAVNKCDQLKEMMEKIEELVKSPINYIHESISDLKLRIDLAREEMKLKIDEEAETILRNLEEYESDCKKSSESNENDSKVKEIMSKSDIEKLDLDEWTSYLSEFKVNCKEYENIENKCEESIGQLQNELDGFKKSLLMDKFYENEKVVIDFEKIKISFDYK